MTARLADWPGVRNRLESATISRDPLLVRARPTGASPTRSQPISARRGSLRSRSAESATTASLSLAVTHSTWPLAGAAAHPASSTAVAAAGNARTHALMLLKLRQVALAPACPALKVRLNVQQLLQELAGVALVG